MEPLFMDMTVIDKAVLLEWHRYESHHGNPVFVGMSLGMVGVYLLFGLVLCWSASVLRMGIMWAFAAVFFLLAALFFANYMLRYRLQVRGMLMRDKAGVYPTHMAMLLYADAVLPVPVAPGSSPEQAEARLWAVVDEARGMQQDLAGVAEDMQGLNMENPEKLDDVREKLEALQARMEKVANRARQIGPDAQYAYSRLTGYYGTKNLHVLQFGEQAVLLDKRGFVRGSNAQFQQFLAKKLWGLAQGPVDAKQKRRLEKAARQLEE